MNAKDTIIFQAELYQPICDENSLNSTLDISTSGLSCSVNLDIKPVSKPPAVWNCCLTNLLTVSPIKTAVKKDALH